MSVVQIDRLRDRVMGCWIGKAVGGTLGIPYEGVYGPVDLTFYDPIPTGMVANDDLDLQVLWACKLAEMDRPVVGRDWIGKAFLEHVEFPWDEYGVAIRNLKAGLRPPLTGSHDNWFANGMGAAIRTEIWACLAAGNGELAAKYAYEDACLDHDGEGIWAAVFLAALEAEAFVEHDRERLLDSATMKLPVTSLIRRCITDTRLWWAERGDWREVRRRILKRYGHENFTDVTMNLGFTILGWLAGGDDFGRSICIANNCGQDTDCTAATLGSILGIIRPDDIPDRWTSPIGRDLVVDARITDIHPPKTLDGFTDLMLNLRERVAYREPVVETDDTTKPKGIRVEIDTINDAAFHERNPLPHGTPPLTKARRSVVLPGTVGSLPAEEFPGEHLVLRYNVTLERAQRIRVGFNSKQANRLWMDGHYLFGRESGRMCPALHRPAMNQFADIDLAAGPHAIVATVARPTEGAAEWVITIGDAKTHQWLDVFEKADL